MYVEPILVGNPAFLTPPPRTGINEGEILALGIFIIYINIFFLAKFIH